MQNPPAYVQVDAAGQSSRGNFQYSPLYSRISPSRENDLSGMPNILIPSHHMGHPHSMNTAEINASRLQQLHNRLANPYGPPSSHGRKSMPNGGLVPGLPSFHHGGHQSRAMGFENGLHGSSAHTANLNEAFVNSFGLSSSAFLNPYSFSDRARTPSPLHRFLHSQLLGGQYHGSPGHSGGGEHHFIHDDLLLDSGPFRGLNLSTNFAADERQNTDNHSDPLITSGHLSRSLDDLSVVLDNSNESADLRRRDSSSPDDSLRNDFTATHHSSENISSANTPAPRSSQHGRVMSSSTSSKQQRRLTTRADISRTCPTCGKTFGNSSGLAKHRLTHSDERKYLCTVCMKSFKRQDHLSGHLLTHSDKKPFSCPVENCGKSYCDSRSLKRHLDQHESWMIPDNVRMMYNEVNIADDTDDAMSVMESQDIQSFNQNAEQLRPFACQICRRRFKNGPALNGHMRLHGGFFTKKSGDYSSPPSVTSSVNVDYSAVQSPVDFMDRSDQDDSSRHAHELSDGDWNDAPDPHSASPVPSYRRESADNKALHHVAVIRHVPPVPAPRTPLLSAPSLPPVSSLASPTNSPTIQNPSFSFFPRHSPPLSAPQSVAPPGPSTLAVPAVPAKLRRHSDSDNVVPAKRPCTVTDMLRHTITLNMARKMTSSFLGDDGAGHSNVSMSHDIPIRITEAAGQLGPAGAENSSFQSREDLIAGMDSEHGDRMGDPAYALDDEMRVYHNASPASDFRSGDSPMSLVGSTASGSDHEYPDSPFESTEPVVFAKKLKRKHRPEPLIIPPHGNSASSGSQPLLSPCANFSSRLRSPRIPGLDKVHGSTPPPYTPPPMLSPTRRGSGLFWNVIASTGNVGNATPQSGSRFLLKRSLSSSSSSHLDFRNSHSGPIDEVADPTQSPFTFVSAPETDSIPHINVGDGHQADLPVYNCHSEDAFLSPVGEDPVWIPGVAAGLTDRDLEQFALVTETSAMPKGGQNLELAHHVLFHSAGDVLFALQVLLRKNHLSSFLARHSALRNYHYQNSDIWSPDEIIIFSNALMKHDKDFFLVAGEVNSKNVRQCVEFYYNWKKLLPDEYRRVRAARRRRQQELVTRSKTQQAQKAEPASQLPDPQTAETVSYVCPFPSCGNAFGTKQALSAHSRVHLARQNRLPPTLEMCPPPIPVPALEEESDKYGAYGNTSSQFPFAVLNVNGTAAGDFPCRMCDKVFAGVKSRNAHMKVHRLAENQPAGLMDRP